MSPQERLRATREAKGLSLRSAAKASGVDPSSLSRIERGLQRPSLDTLLRIAEVLGLSNVTDNIALFVDPPQEPPR